MKPSLLAVFLMAGVMMGQGKKPVECKVVPAIDGCNTCTVCGETTVSCTLAYCSKLPTILLPEYYGPSPAQPKAKPEPQFVPAVKKTRKVCMVRPYPVDSSFTCGPVAKNTECPCGDWEDMEYMGCADPKRILLHSEDGLEHWCMKVSSLEK